MDTSGRENDASVTEKSLPPAAAALVVGLGSVGQRVTRRLQMRLADDPLTKQGGLSVLLPVCDAVGLPAAIREAVRAQMQQAAVTRLEARFGIRRPEHRYLKLHLVFVGALAEVADDLLSACMKAAASLDHPPAGLETLFVLDTIEPLDAIEPLSVSPSDENRPTPSPFLARLHALEQGAQELRESQNREWGGAGRLRVVLAHPHRADGSWLGQPEDFEAALASLLAAHLAPGVLHDGLADFADAEMPAFALCGGAGALLPREAILGCASDLLAADILEQTGNGGNGSPEEMIDGDAPDIWRGWQEAKDALLDRRSLLKRLLGPNGSGMFVVAEDESVYARNQPTRRWSLARELKALFWGEERPLHSSDGLRVRLSLPSPRWQAGDPRHWPEELARLDKEGAAALESWLAAAPVLIAPVAEEVAAALSRCVDHCIQRHVGGTAAALALLAEAERAARAGIAESGRTCFAEPLLPDDIGLTPGTTFPEAWEIFQSRCRRIPNWQEALTTGAAWGALVLTACFPFGLLLGFGWIGAGVGLLAGGLYYGWRLGNLKRVGDYLRQCLEAKNGRRLLEYAERAVGTPTQDGVYQAILHFLETVERPAVVQFSQGRQTRIDQARAEQLLPSLGGTDEYLLDLDSAPVLHSLLRRNLCDSQLADAARSLLRSGGLFDGWRTPEWDTVFDQVQRYARRDHLRSWEEPSKALGPFVQNLLPDSLTFSRWVRTTLETLAMRSMLLALRPPAHLDRDDAQIEHRGESPAPVTAVRMAVPASLGWHAAQADPTGSAAARPGEQPLSPPDTDTRRLPPGSAAADLADWYGGDANACRVESDEGDTVTCLVLTTGLTAAQALAAIRSAPAAPSIAIPESLPRNGHSRANGNGKGSGNGNGNGNGNGHGSAPDSLPAVRLVGQEIEGGPDS